MLRFLNSQIKFWSENLRTSRLFLAVAQLVLLSDINLMTHFHHIFHVNAEKG